MGFGHVICDSDKMWHVTRACAIVWQEPGTSGTSSVAAMDSDVALCPLAGLGALRRQGGKEVMAKRVAAILSEMQGADLILKLQNVALLSDVARVSLGFVHCPPRRDTRAPGSIWYTCC